MLEYLGICCDNFLITFCVLQYAITCVGNCSDNFLITFCALQCAIRALNDLQRPLSHEKSGAEHRHMTKHDKMLQCLGRLGFTAEDLNRINAVHVAGTQGKVCIKKCLLL